MINPLKYFGEKRIGSNMRNADIIAWDVPGCKKKFFRPKIVYTYTVIPPSIGAAPKYPSEKRHITWKNLFILGAPGQAKSCAINQFRARITGARQFERHLSKRTTSNSFSDASI